MQKTIKLINVEKKQRGYLKPFNVDLLEKLSLDQGNIFFVNIINDFKVGKLVLDELSVFGFNIFHKIAKKYPKSDLFQASLSASELNFEVRFGVEYRNLPMYLSDVDIFLKKYNKN